MAHLACAKPRRILRAHPSDASTAAPEVSDNELEVEQVICVSDSDCECDGRSSEEAKGPASTRAPSKGSCAETASTASDESAEQCLADSDALRCAATAPPPACCGGLLAVAARLTAMLKNALSDFEHDPDAVLAAVRKDGLALRWAAPSLRDSDVHAWAAVRSNGLALRYVSERLAADCQLVRAAVREEGEALEFAAPTLRDDRHVVEAALARNGLALRWASTRLQGDRALALLAVRSHGLALGLLSEDFRADVELVEAATRSCADAWQYAALHLQDRRDSEETLECLEAQASSWQRCERDAFRAAPAVEAEPVQRRRLVEATRACTRALGQADMWPRAVTLCDALTLRLRRQLSTEEVAAAALVVVKFQVAGTHLQEALPALAEALPALELPVEPLEEEAAAIQGRFARLEAEVLRVLEGNVDLPSAVDWAELMLRRLSLELPLQDAEALRLAAPSLRAVAELAAEQPSTSHRTPQTVAAGALARWR